MPRHRQAQAQKSERQITELTDRVVKGVTETLGYRDELVSTAFQEVSSGDWAEKVYRPAIQGQQGRLAKKPGYKIYISNRRNKN